MPLLLYLQTKYFHWLIVESDYIVALLWTLYFSFYSISHCPRLSDHAPLLLVVEHGCIFKREVFVLIIIGWNTQNVMYLSRILGIVLLICPEAEHMANASLP